MDNPSDTGWIVVENPFETERNFIFSSMVSGPPPSIYPEVVIRIYHAEEEGEEAIEIATEHIDPTTMLSHMALLVNPIFFTGIHL